MSPCPSVSLLLIFFLTSVHAASADGGSTIIIHETCKKCAQEDPNVSYKFCVASLESNPYCHCDNLRGLGLVSIKLLRHNVTRTRSYTEKLLKSKEMDPSVRACLQDCLELYSDAVATLAEAIRAYKDERYGDANIDLSSVMDASTTCEDGFTEKGTGSPLARRNKDAFRLSALALSIITMLSRSSH
ncbi:putative invertase inhibitor [Eucalyptus grandis]|uniref:putative invertase inhibitor n=1 Tax=Eucalyptus grandis TaxID=71139 RepID=UPI00192EFFDD|nr:putative invertase inhibitor [Eucalyptus grandis]